MADILYEVVRDYSTSIYHSIGKNDAFLHFHHQVELLYVEKGKVDVTINDEEEILQSGELAIIDCFDNHKFIHEEGAISHSMTIPVHFLKKYTMILNNKALKDHFIIDKVKAKKIFDCMSNVANAINSNELILDGEIQILLGNIIDDNLVDEKNKTNYNLVKNILMYIEENYKTQISLDTIAKHFGYSKYYFSHLFNKCFNCNLNDYINLVRCRHSINYVLEEHMSVSDAAFNSGFVSMRTFYRTFKKCFKVTPKEYFQEMQRNKTMGQ